MQNARQPLCRSRPLDAPDFAGAATKRQITLSLVDASNDVITLQVDGLPIAATDAQIEAIAVAAQAASQASLYDIADKYSYKGAKLSSNAEDDQRNSIKDGINILYRNSSDDTVTFRAVAPVPATMVGDTDSVDTSNALVVAINTAIEAAATGYTAESAQYTERRERGGNERDSF